MELYKEGQRLLHQKYRKENPQAYKIWYEANLEKAHASQKAWKRNNKEKVLCTNRNRWALKKGAEGRHSEQDIENILKEQNYLCNGCSVFLESYHVDHMIPLSRGGSNWPSNLQCLCSYCNCSKNNKTMDEWLNLIKDKQIA